MSVRKAAAAASMSEGRWRQVELGYQQVASGVRVPARPRESTVKAMARAIGLDVSEALGLAGYPVEDPHPVRTGSYAAGEPTDGQDVDVFAAIEADLRLLPEAKAHLLNQYELLLRLQDGPAEQVLLQRERRLAAEIEAEEHRRLDETIYAEQEQEGDAPQMAPRKRPTRHLR